MRLVLPFPPSANNYWRMVKGRMLLSRQAREYREQCAFAATLQWKHALVESAVALRLDLFFPDRRGDLDNRIKVAIDSLRGVAFVDDSQIYDLRAVRHLDRANPRVEVTVEPISEAAA